MTESDTDWLKRHNANLVGVTELRNRKFNSMFFKPSTNADYVGLVDFVNHDNLTNLYKIEVPEYVLRQWKYYEDRLRHILADSDRHGMPPSDFFFKNLNGHHKLLAENSMYREAWTEFQSLRVLLGEDSNWP